MRAMPRTTRLLLATALVSAFLAAGAPTVGPVTSAAATPAVSPVSVAVPNSGFEQRLHDWRPVDKNSAMWRSPYSYRGKSAMFAHARTAGPAYVQPDDPIITSTGKGTSYTVTVYVAGGRAGDKARLEFLETKGGSTTAKSQETVELTSSQWRKVTLTHEGNFDGGTLTLRLGSPHLAAKKGIRFDQVSVSASTAGTAPSPISSPAPSPAPTPPPAPEPIDPPPAPERQLVFGASAANKTQILEHERDLGRKLGGVRVFKKWDSTLFPADMAWARDNGRSLFLSIRAERSNGTAVRWADIAAAQPGSKLHDDMLRQAAQIEAFKAPVYITFNHEPEAKDAQHLGDGADFIAAWRKVINTYRAAGVTNAEYIWTMTGYGFARTDSQAAVHYWPGAAYVDHIGADVYNWYNCRETKGTWGSMAAKVEKVRQFGAQYPDKSIVIMEYSSAEDSERPGRKAQWIDDAAALFHQPGYEQFSGVLQWSGRNFSTDESCDFDYRSSASATAALREMGSAPGYQATTLP